MRDIIRLEMVFCNEHTLIVYPKTVFTRAGPTLEVDTSSAESSEDEVLEAEESLGVSHISQVLGMTLICPVLLVIV